jgi:hypothetical protein
MISLDWKLNGSRDKTVAVTIKQVLRDFQTKK